MLCRIDKDGKREPVTETERAAWYGEQPRPPEQLLLEDNEGPELDAHYEPDETDLVAAVVEGETELADAVFDHLVRGRIADRLADKRIEMAMNLWGPDEQEDEEEE